jgi:UDP-GlcNAc3NAcA epimerase
MLAAVEDVMLKERQDWVLIYGDTNSTLAGALAAAKLHIPVAHVEAGLRSFNMRMPEEINRVLADRISNVLFCPTDQAVRNLEAEGFRNLDVDILKVGDVMLDAALFYQKRAQRPKGFSEGFENQEFALATVHRAENTDSPDRLAEIVAGLNALHKDIPVILPLHPRTKKQLETQGLTLNVQIIDPVGYLEMIWLLDHCRLVLTDSGGLQKEAWFFQKPCVTLRDETEWVELVDAGGNRLAGADATTIMESVRAALDSRPDFSTDLYGGGQAAGKIVQRLLETRGCLQ